jgi:L-aspartate oxidase
MPTSDAGLVRTDAAVVGGGLAGLWAVLHLPHDWEVVVVDPGQTGGGSSPWAQGGMAVAVSPDDSPELHAQDTMRAGAGLCRPGPLAVLVEEAPAALSELVDLGVEFDRSPDGSLDLNREGGQSLARSVHAADATGREIMRVVAARARDRARRLIGTASRLIVSDGACGGVRVATSHGEIDVAARVTLLATGGCGALWPSTTNPETATGDAVSLAWDAGADLTDLEFMQFHPTALAAGGLRRVLLSEALRGEGAIVVDDDGGRFLFESHPDGELAPRDVVARAIAARGTAYLDARPIGARGIRSRFPNITAAVAEAGFDLTAQPVPIAPAAHYFLGGVESDVDGRTSVPSLYAAGECAATGVHGANRMAGNSLTEAVVFGRRAALAMGRDEGGTIDVHDGSDEEAPAVTAVDPTAWTRLRQEMMVGAGLTRSAAVLQRARAAIEDIAASAPEALRRAARTASLVCTAALERAESRGVHYRTDHPEASAEWDSKHVTYRSN